MKIDKKLQYLNCLREQVVEGEFPGYNELIYIEMIPESNFISMNYHIPHDYLNHPYLLFMELCFSYYTNGYVQKYKGIYMSTNHSLTRGMAWRAKQGDLFSPFWLSKYQRKFVKLTELEEQYGANSLKYVLYRIDFMKELVIFLAPQMDFYHPSPKCPDFWEFFRGKCPGPPMLNELAKYPHGLRYPDYVKLVKKDVETYLADVYWRRAGNFSTRYFSIHETYKTFESIRDDFYAKLKFEHTKKTMMLYSKMIDLYRSEWLVWYDSTQTSSYKINALVEQNVLKKQEVRKIIQAQKKQEYNIISSFVEEYNKSLEEILPLPAEINEPEIEPEIEPAEPEIEPAEPKIEPAEPKIEPVKSEELLLLESLESKNLLDSSFVDLQEHLKSNVVVHDKMEKEESNLQSLPSVIPTYLPDLWSETVELLKEDKQKENKKENQVYHIMFRWTEHEKIDMDYFLNEETLLRIFEPVSKMGSLVFQLELGEKTNKKHWQGYTQLLTKIRPSTLGSRLNSQLFGIQILPVKSEPKHCIDYCSKPGTRLKGPFPEGAVYTGEELKVVFTNPRGWQKYVNEYLDQKPVDTEILYIYDEKGGAGKSLYAKALNKFLDASLISWAQPSDILYMAAMAVKNGRRKIFITDLPRNKPSTVTWESVFSALEQIKTGHWNTAKFQGFTVNIPNPHLIVFSNSLPKLKSLSLHKWKVMQIFDPTSYSTGYIIWSSEQIRRVAAEQKKLQKEMDKVKGKFPNV